jgi:hypothetical protein
MTRTTLSLVALSLISVGCSAPDATAPAANTESATPEFASGSRVIHRASVGSHDFTPPGVDANFSLIALQRANGTVTGQYNDQFGHGNGGVHADVDCLRVVGNKAWIGGLVKNGQFEGERVVTEVEDNGTSTNEPPDRISFSIINPAQFGLSEDCRLLPELPLFPLQGGEVKVE